MSDHRPQLPKPPSSGALSTDFRPHENVHQDTQSGTPFSPHERHHTCMHRGRVGTLLTILACLLLLACLGVAFGSALRTVVGQGGSFSWSSVRQGTCRFLLSVGLPDLNTPLGAEKKKIETTAAQPQENTDPQETADTVTETTASLSDSESASEPSTVTLGDPTETVPPDCIPVVSLDMSCSEAGVDYMERDAGCDVEPADGPLWDAVPTVLIVHTHPFEAFGDGAAWHPAIEDWALTDRIDDPCGVVALGAQLATRLEAAGLRVLHLDPTYAGIPSGASYRETFRRTEALVADYLRLYPEIGLVIDLRRSAELTHDGAILRTVGVWEDEPCAQIRVVVDADRSRETVSRALTLATEVRRELWNIAPAISRPVWLRDSSGLNTGGGIVTVTIELGAAGNTFADAERLIEPLAEVLATSIKRSSE